MLKSKYKLNLEIKLSIEHMISAYIDAKEGKAGSENLNLNSNAMIIVQQALEELGEDIYDAKLREKLRQGIINNICDRKKYKYAYLDLPGISRNRYYNYRNQLCYQIAKEMDYIK